MPDNQRIRFLFAISENYPYFCIKSTIQSRIMITYRELLPSEVELLKTFVCADVQKSRL